MECNFWLLGVHRHIIAAGEETDGLYDIIEGVAKSDSCRKCCSNGTVAIRIFRPLTGRLLICIH